MSLVSNEIKNWVPWKLSGSLSEWLYTGDRKFTEPFFSDTVSACRKLKENCAGYKIVSNLEMMLEWAKDIDSLVPSAIIFHVSRCGSTLLSQLLSLHEANIVLSEVPFFDEILCLPFRKQSISLKTVNAYLTAAVKHYGRIRTGRETHLFIKSDSWHLHFYEQLRFLFPGVPFVLLYRDPAEVLFSQQRQRGMQSVPGIIEPEIFGFSKEQVDGWNLDAYMANVLAGYFRKMIEILQIDPLAFAFNYREGMSCIAAKIANVIKTPLTGETQKLINERCRFHGKYPYQLFNESKKNPFLATDLSTVTHLYRQLDDVSVPAPFLAIRT